MASDTVIMDTVRNRIRVGTCLYLTQHIDSTVIIVSQSATVIDAVITCTEKGDRIDTIYYDIRFRSAQFRNYKAPMGIVHSWKITGMPTLPVFSDYSEGYVRH